MSFAAGQNLNSGSSGQNLNSGSSPAESGPATQSLPSSSLTEDEGNDLVGLSWSDVYEHAKHNGIFKMFNEHHFSASPKTKEQDLPPLLSAFHAQMQ